MLLKWRVLLVEYDHFKRVKSSWRIFTFDEKRVARVFDVIYQTRDTVFHYISITEKRVENTRFLILP